MFGEDIILGYTDPVPENKEFIVDTVNTLSNKVITVNEGRKILNKLLDDVDLEPLPDGDVIYQMDNLVPMGTPAPTPIAQPTNEPINDKPIGEPAEGKSFKKKVNKAFFKNLDKEAYCKSFIEKTEKQEKEMIPIWEDIFNHQKDKILANIKSSKAINTKGINIDDILKFLNSNDESDYMTKQILPTLKDIMKDKGEQVFNELNIDTSFNLHDPKVTDWMNEFCGKQITNINDTTKTLVREQLKQGQENGESIPNLCDRINQYFDDTESSRVKTICRTEVIGASNNATLLGYKQSGVVDNKQWLATEDARTRPTHAEADGQVVGIDEKFIVGGEEMDCPGDMDASPENVCNCRCTLIGNFD